MVFNAKNGKVEVHNTYMDYISFGEGEKALIMLPGLGDAFRTVKGTALPMAVAYQMFAQDYTVYMFSRKMDMQENYSSRDMSRDLKKAMEKLGIAKADVLGVSQGGTIAQYLAIDYPRMVDKLVLAVTYARPNETLRNSIGKWIGYAERKDYRNIMIDTTENSYSEAYLKKVRKQYWLLTRIGKPKSFERFLTMANACLTHDAYDELDKIICPTLIIGGREDKIVTGRASEEMAEVIPNSELYMYDGLGHATYDEAPDFNLRVLNFLKK